MMRSALNEYDLFAGISEKDQEMLLPCINARFADLQAGQSIRLDPDTAALILDGEAVVSGGGAAGPGGIAAGPVFGTDSLLMFDAPVTVTARKHCLLMKMERHMMYSPCWFSCSFHHRLMQNANEMLRRSE